jgi:quercetin dioxygenase-like cupin family protein
VVTIQALQGELSIRSEDEEYKLLPNMMVVFAPNVRHSVLAVKASAMLLSVCLINNAAEAIR